MHNNIINVIGIKVIVLVRNISDTVISMADHFCTKSTSTSLPYIEKGFYELSKKNKFECIISKIAPCYLSLFDAWQSAYFDNPNRILFLTYRQLFNQRSDIVQHICLTLKISHDKNAVKAFLSKKGRNRSLSNFNVVKTKRVEEYLIIEQIQKI